MPLYLANTETRVIHRERPEERCNADAMRYRMKIDETEKDMTLRSNPAWRLCEYCFPDERELVPA